nr:hypothetical protein [Microctonus hyperodae filamentous virus]
MEKWQTLEALRLFIPDLSIKTLNFPSTLRYLKVLGADITLEDVLRLSTHIDYLTIHLDKLPDTLTKEHLQTLPQLKDFTIKMYYARLGVVICRDSITLMRKQQDSHYYSQYFEFDDDVWDW